MGFIKANTLVCALDSCQNFLKLYKQKLKKQSEHSPRDMAPHSSPDVSWKERPTVFFFFLNNCDYAPTAAGKCGGWRQPPRTARREAANNPLGVVNFTRAPCTKGRGKAATACKPLPSLRRDGDRVALWGLSPVSETGSFTGKPRQTENQVPSQETSGEEQPRECSPGAASAQ